MKKSVYNITVFIKDYKDVSLDFLIKEEFDNYIKSLKGAIEAASYNDGMVTLYTKGVVSLTYKSSQIQGFLTDIVEGKRWK